MIDDERSLDSPRDINPSARSKPSSSTVFMAGDRSLTQKRWFISQIAGI
jgi:hypothetical protein